MRFVYQNLELSPEAEDQQIYVTLAALLGCSIRSLGTLTIVRKAIDARRKPRVRLVFKVSFVPPKPKFFTALLDTIPDLSLEPEPTVREFSRLAAVSDRIIIAGMGPAGLFSALRLLEYGLRPTLLERGKPVDERSSDVQRFWREGLLDPESNVQFGEGGAGTFSDGKLTCRTRTLETPYVLKSLVRFGAPEEILYQAKPHIGTDLLRGIIRQIRRHLEAEGCVVRFSSRLDQIIHLNNRITAIVTGSEEIPCDHLILATGHSARDTYAMLHSIDIPLEPKPFAMGLRVEHPQELIDRIQYGRACSSNLPPAEYFLTWNDRDSGRSAYSFCMCPGGVVIAGASEPGGVVTNGMSLHGRNSGRANSALVVTVRPEDFHGSDPLGGVRFQQHWERIAFAAGGGGYRAPSQNLISFISGKGGNNLSSYKPGTVPADLAEILPTYLTDTLRNAIRHFDHKMRGFMTAEAVLTGIESRTSAPLRILRNEQCESPGLSGLYPTGEGAGYAGGIMSSALDGIRVADAISGRISSGL